MTQAKSGDTVSVHYTGRLNDGTIFDSSVDSDPLQFVLGSGQVIPGFDQAVSGMQLGESKTTVIPADEAYGQPNPQLVLQVARDQFPQHIEPKLNEQLQLRQPDGETFVVTITAVADDEVTLDGNHPLAGQDLTFILQLVEIA